MAVPVALVLLVPDSRLCAVVGLLVLVTAVALDAQAREQLLADARLLVQANVARGYLASPALQRARQFGPLRGTPAFESLMVDAEGGRLRALDAFRNAGGEKLLGSREPR